MKNERYIFHKYYLYIKELLAFENPQTCLITT